MRYGGSGRGSHRVAAEYSGLSDEEIATLQDFFVDSRGNAELSFTFLDPTANLLAWSENSTSRSGKRTAAGRDGRRGFGVDAAKHRRRPAEDFADPGGAGGFPLLPQRLCAVGTPSAVTLRVGSERSERADRRRIGAASFSRDGAAGASRSVRPGSRRRAARWTCTALQVEAQRSGIGIQADAPRAASTRKRACATTISNHDHGT